MGAKHAGKCQALANPKHNPSFPRSCSVRSHLCLILQFSLLSFLLWIPEPKRLILSDRSSSQTLGCAPSHCHWCKHPLHLSNYKKFRFHDFFPLCMKLNLIPKFLLNFKFACMCVCTGICMWVQVNTGIS